jgi:hypothetical protein
MDGYATKVWFLQNSLRMTQEVEYKWFWKSIMNSLISRGYNSGLVKDDLSIDSSTVASKKDLAKIIQVGAVIVDETGLVGWTQRQCCSHRCGMIMAKFW